MTSKKRRQRGSRTHGGGTHKNRRGAGNRGGRGRAGRKGHEEWNYPPLGKSGFKRPQKVQDTVLEVKAQKLDEDADLYVADDLAEKEDGVYHFDARDIVEDGYDADVVKVLGGGQVRKELHVVADAFTAGAHEQIEEAGGTCELSERAEEAEEETESEAEAESEE